MKPDDVILSSHVASASVPAVRKLRETAAHLAATAFRGEPLPNVVNGVTPSIGPSSKPSTAHCRLPTDNFPHAAARAFQPVLKTTTSGTVCVSIDDLRSFGVDALVRAGMNAEDAATTAEALVSTDAMGVFTHGTKLLAGYLKS